MPATLIDTADTSRWRRVLALPGFKTAAAFLGNELLMLATPWWPLPWAIPYFPIKAVGIPAFALFEVMTLAASYVAIRSRATLLRAAAGITIAVGVTWLNWRYDPAPLLDLTGRGRSEERPNTVLQLPGPR